MSSAWKGAGRGGWGGSGANQPWGKVVGSGYARFARLLEIDVWPGGRDGVRRCRWRGTGPDHARARPAHGLEQLGRVWHHDRRGGIPRQRRMAGEAVEAVWL